MRRTLIIPWDDIEKEIPAWLGDKYILSNPLEAIYEMCVMGLNSENPKHWEAALQDILIFIRKEYDKLEINIQ